MHAHLILCFFAFLAYCRGPLERIRGIDERWERLDKADPDLIIHLRIVIRGQNDKAFEELAWNIATPFSGSYRKHLTASELAAWTGPLKEHVDLVLSWLTSHQIQGHQNHDIVEAAMPISTAEKLLNTTYFSFQDEKGTIVPRTDEYYIPVALSECVEFVHPTVNFPHRSNEQRAVEATTPLAGSDVDAAGLQARQTNPCEAALIDPACVLSVYNVDYTPPRDTTASVEIYLGGGFRVNKTNLDIYLEHFNPPAARANASFHYHHIGPTQHATAGVTEEQLDMQMVLGHGWPLDASYTSIQGNAFVYQWGPRVGQHLNQTQREKIHQYEEPYINYLHSLAHKEFVPAAVTISEFQVEALLTPSYMRYVCKVFGQISARGVSAFAATGDTGSSAAFDKKTQEPRYRTAFPATCPFLTSVGATVYGNNSEVAVTFQTRAFQGIQKFEFASGGGFSLVFPRPKYQETKVPEYLKNNMIIAKYGNQTDFNPAGRGFPDIGAFGSRVAGVSRGRVAQIAGTSASSPMIAAIMGRLAAYEKSRGRPSLGLLNPWLYNNSGLLNDITCCGDNDIYDFYPPYPKTGFPVSRGWDAVTGLGSVNFAKLRKALDDMATAGALG